MPSNLPLIPDVPFAEGTLYTPELAYLSFYSPVFDDQPQYLGHRARLLDTELSNTPGQIKSRVALLEAGLSPSLGTGLVVTIQAGTIRKTDGSLLAIPGQQVTVPDNATSFIWVDDTGVLSVSGQPPVIRRLIARVVTGGGAITTLEDLRHTGVRDVLPVAASIRSFGGSNTTDKVCTNNEVLGAGVYYFRNFSVPAGVSITVSQYARIICSGTAVVAGTVNVTQVPNGAPAGYFVTAANATVGYLPGQGIGSKGISYSWGLQPWGTGGSLGGLMAPVGTPYSWGMCYPGGDSGGCFWLEAALAVTVTGTIFVRGANGQQGSTANNGTPGAIANGVFGVISGSGGGSGGLCMLSSLVSVTVAPSASIDVRGGRGGDGFVYVPSGSYLATGGFGAPGGYVVLMSPSNNTTGANILLDGGANGNPAGNVTTISSNVYTVPNPTIVVSGGLGGGFGGITGGHSFNITAPVYTITNIAGTAGQLVVRQFTPLG